MFLFMRRATACFAVCAIPITTAHSTPPAPLCSAKYAQPKAGSDGRLLNHFPYAEAPASSLAKVPAGFSSGSCAMVRADILPDLTAMIAAAKKDKIVLRGVSCFRSISYQRTVFCNAGKIAAAGGTLAARARSSAPPGYSEHASGYVIDFGLGDADLVTAFATRPMGKWLAANAGKYGFELSFPKGNKQGVMFEPWHWRWLGSRKAGPNGSTPDQEAAAQKARETFANARNAFAEE
jgi:zinc D-Ala-D-Ala carboxypeptidase